MEIGVELIVVLVLICLGLGALLSFMVFKANARTAISSAVLKAQSDSGVEISMLKERIRSLEEARQQDQNSIVQSVEKYEECRIELSTCRDELSKLIERARRVETLESELANANALLKTNADELRRITGDASEKAANAVASARKVQEIQAELEQLKRVRDELQSATLLFVVRTVAQRLRCPSHVRCCQPQ